jgi:hypothetical protein
MSRLFSVNEQNRRSASGKFAGLLTVFGCITAICVLAMCAGAAMAQLSGKGAIKGTVTDKTGAVIPDATIIATNGGSGISTTTKSTATGDYNFSDLDPGIYTVTITAKGFEKLKQENIHVNAMEAQSFNPSLTVGGADVEVTVSAEPPQIETSNATLGATMEQATYAELPIEMGAYGSPDQRRATDFVYLMPGVQGNETNGNATTNTGVVNGSGSRGAVSDVYIDGIPFVRAGGNGDPRFVWTAISVDAVDQFQLQTSGYSAIYEGQGVMNYSIKQGGQMYHAAVYEFFRNTALDTWGFFKVFAPGSTTRLIKPIEHSNEYGINLGGPLIPINGLRDKLYFFTNYNGFRYASGNPTPMRFPTNAEKSGDFSADGINIYDPGTEAACAATNPAGVGKPCRNQYAGNMIPSAQFSAVALKIQSMLPSITSNATGNNYTAANNTGLVNWSTTSRIDYVMNQRDTLTVIGAVGRQASSVPVGQTTAGRNVGPVPYNYGQAYAPKTAVWTLEETHTFSPNLLNQLKWGYARYNGPTFNPDDSPKYSAQSMGFTGTPQGQATNMFPITCFSTSTSTCSTSNSYPTQWNGATETTTVAANYTALDNLQWNKGRHAFTFGGQVAWMLYNVINAAGGSTPITLSNATTETAQLNNAFSAVGGTGIAYASFLIGQIDKGSFTQYLQQEFGARFRAISPYFQDDWKVNSKLTLNLGLRYDFYPTVREVHNAESYFSPTLANPVTGLNGALQFTGNGTGTCNCKTPVNDYYKNFGPRVGLAYLVDSKTVIRASYGVMFTHGGAVGGLNTSLGTLGFAASPSFSSNGSLLSTFPLTGTNGAIPAYSPALGVSSGPAYGTGYVKTASQGAVTGSPSSGMNYNDPYYGSRAPEFLNWSFGIQRQLTNSLALTASYVGSEGHFLQLDSYHARGVWADDLNPQYLGLGVRLADTGTTATTVTADCATYGLPCAGLSNFTTSQPLSQLLKPFPFQAVADNFGYVGNTNYHALQALISMRTWHGLTLNANYSFSKAIDDAGSFRTGYAIPAGTLANNPTKSYAPDRIERSVSTANQPQHFVATAVWETPFGKTLLNQGAVERAILGGFKFSGVYQAFSGSPLALTENSTQVNPAESTFMPILNPNFTGQVRVNGKWGHGASGDPRYPVTISYIAPSTGTSVSTAQGPFMNPVSGILNSYNYQISDAPRTAPYHLYGPGNYNLDLGMSRTFPLHITESSKFNFRAEWYNITNHTLFGIASTAVGNASFGQVTQSSIYTRKAAQFSARIEF